MGRAYPPSIQKCLGYVAKTNATNDTSEDQERCEQLETLLYVTTCERRAYALGRQKLSSASRIEAHGSGTVQTNQAFHSLGVSELVRDLFGKG